MHGTPLFIWDSYIQVQILVYRCHLAVFCCYLVCFMANKMKGSEIKINSNKNRSDGSVGALANQGQSNFFCICSPVIPHNSFLFA